MLDADQDQLTGLGVHGVNLPDDVVLVLVIALAVWAAWWASVQWTREEWMALPGFRQELAVMTDRSAVFGIVCIVVGNLLAVLAMWWNLTNWTQD